MKNKQNRKPLYGIMARTPDNDLYGFSGRYKEWFKNGIRLYDYDEKLLNEKVEQEKRANLNWEIFITRIHSENCPINVNYNETLAHPYSWVHQFHRKGTEYF